MWRTWTRQSFSIITNISTRSNCLPYFKAFWKPAYVSLDRPADRRTYMLCYIAYTFQIFWAISLERITRRFRKSIRKALDQMQLSLVDQQASSTTRSKQTEHHRHSQGAWREAPAGHVPNDQIINTYKICIAKTNIATIEYQRLVSISCQTQER